MSARTAVLRFIEDFTAEYGYAPTVRQIGEGVGLASPASVHGHLQTLVRRGELVHTPRGYMLPVTTK